MTGALRLASHEWKSVARDPRFLLPFLAVPMILVALHAAAAALLPVPPAEFWTAARTFLAVMSWVGASMAVPLGADAFAGEKERQTLETLLCLPLSRRELFLGKVLGILPFPLGVGWLGQFAVLAMTPAVASMPWPERLGPVLQTPFLALLFCALAVLISLRFDSMRAAAQITGFLLLLLFPAVMAGSHFLLRQPGSLMAWLAALAAGAGLCFALAARRFAQGRL